MESLNHALVVLCLYNGGTHNFAMRTTNTTILYAKPLFNTYKIKANTVEMRTLE